MSGPTDRPFATTALVAGFLAVVGANLLPLVGVVAWEWTLWSLLVVYWMEALSTVLLAAAKTLFAERGSPGVPGGIEPLHELREKRGGWRFHDSWPPVYPRNVPFALSILGVWAVTVIPLSAFYWLSVAPDVRLSLHLVLAIGALFVAQAADFAFEYVGEREYETVSAQQIVRTPAQLSALVLSLGLFTADAGRASGILVLLAVVLAKTTLSAYRFYVEHVGTPVLSLSERFFGGDDSEPPPELDLPDADVRARVTVDAKPVLLGSLWAVAYGFASRVGLATLALLGLSLAAGEWLWFAVALLLALAIVAARVSSYYLRYGTVEYQRRGDRLVAYDTALDAPQWIVAVDSTTEFAVRNAIADRLLGTGTLTITDAESVDRDVQLGPVSDVDRAVEALDLPVGRTERPARDPAVIVAAGVLALFFLAVPVGLFLTPRVDDATATGIAVAFGPFLLVPVVALLWAALSRI